jgi:predicted benzoate:H+ symporter BenE
VVIGILAALACLALLGVCATELRAALRGERDLDRDDRSAYVAPFVTAPTGLVLAVVGVAEADAGLQLFGAGGCALVALLTSPLHSFAPLRLKREHGAPASRPVRRR